MTTSKQNLTHVIQRAEELRLLNRNIGRVTKRIKANTTKRLAIEHRVLRRRDQLMARRAEVLNQLDPCGGDVHRIVR